MNIEDLTIRQVNELTAMFGNQSSQLNNGMLGQYVIVRCRDAGVHCGYLHMHHGRECVLTDSRRLWGWKPAKGKWLSAVANHGLHSDSMISEVVARIHLTEDCEIIQCTDTAAESIRSFPSHG